MGLGSALKKAVKGVSKVFSPAEMLSAAGTIGGMIFGNNAAEEAQERQQEFDLKMWNLQNEYNTPANQVARLRAAGLNPNLFYGQGNVGNATSAPTTQAVKYNYDFAKAFDKAALAAQVDNMHVQNENLQAQNDNLHATTKGIELENKLKERDLELYEKYGLIPHGSMQQQLWKTGRDIGGYLLDHSADVKRWLIQQFWDAEYEARRPKGSIVNRSDRY